MTTSQIIQTIFEFSLVLLLVAGIIFEPQLVEFEKKVFRRRRDP